MSKPLERALSRTQILGLFEVKRKKVRLSCKSGTIKQGGVALKTLWSLEDRGLVTSDITPRLTPYGKQIMYWIESSDPHSYAQRLCY